MAMADQEIQVWMPDGDKGEDNFLTLQEYVDLAIRQDGALFGSIASCKAYNKVLNQLTKVVAAVATFIAQHGYAVRDADTVETIADNFFKAVGSKNDTDIDTFAETLQFTIDEDGNLVAAYGADEEQIDDN